MERRRKRRGLVARWTARVARGARWCAAQGRTAWRTASSRLRPWKPVVLVDARRGRARRLRRMLSRATRAQFRALRVAPPQHLLIVVQRAVHGDRPLAALLQVFEQADGTRRHVLFLALSVGEESTSDGAIVATLRQQLHAVVGDALGALVAAVPCEPSPVQRSATVIPLRRHEAEPPPFEDAPPPDDTWNPGDDGYPVAAER